MEELITELLMKDLIRDCGVPWRKRFFKAISGLRGVAPTGLSFVYFLPTLFGSQLLACRVG
jgi:hypothetical protein